LIELKKRLEQNGIKPSFVRLKVYEYLIANKTHPTADEVYNKLIGQIPTLSKTSVYNTLNLFVEKNLAQLITIEDNVARYDADISVHGHFQCNMCGKVYDFMVDAGTINSNLPDDFEVKQISVYYKGICPYCKNKN